MLYVTLRYWHSGGAWIRCRRHPSYVALTIFFPKVGDPFFRRGFVIGVVGVVVVVVVGVVGVAVTIIRDKRGG